MANKLQGKVASVTPAGDAVTDISVAALTEIDNRDEVRITCAEHVTLGVFPEDHQQPEMTFIAVMAANGFLELRLVGDSLNAFLGISVGDDVKLQW